MQKTSSALLILSTAVSLILSACNALPNLPPASAPFPTATPTANPTATPTANSGPITIKLQLDALKQGFEIKSTVQLHVYPCSSSGYPTDNPVLSPCVTGQKPLYEQSVIAQATPTTLEIQVPGLKIGDTVELSGSGHDRGQCNNIGGRKAFKITANTVEVTDFPWATTDRGCIFKASVQGKILDQNQRPVENAKIEAKSLNGAITYQETVTSDAEGRYQLKNVPENVEVEIAVSKSGYQSQSQKKAFQPGQEKPPLTVSDVDIVLPSNS
ncbi:MAG: carboxypeptidase-like regulatory domain-containing protein [Candidatus Sericytochromatia bacterium]